MESWIWKVEKRKVRKKIIKKEKNCWQGNRMSIYIMYQIKKRGNEMRIEYVKDGINKVEICDTYEEIEKFVEENNLVESREPENEGEYRITE